ncbi:hypothetical protein S40285_03309 [Stachybotrys chlorohalonatus IBT 40285]|uniref:Cell wall protein PhiA n=1 Tax=Stachybotrys chlorohalonatus (strain IBT 40285) TaxID=1283841 RepID=A0A084R1L8_STAC4|nr:hypothetical protein S40285_03309 [Stachybotrys chlorohalonata IBT 40285]
MKFSGLLSLLPLAVAAPAPAATEAPQPDVFSIMSLRSASPIHFGQVSAALGNFFIHLAAPNATCEGDAAGPSAYFQLEDGALVLYSTDGPRQQAYVDRSGMGQGNFGYTTDPTNPPRNGEVTGWAINEAGNLVFDGSEGLLACPNSIDGAWSLWVSAGVTNPGGNEGCLGFSARTIGIDEPASCTYTS